MTSDITLSSPLEPERKPAVKPSPNQANPNSVPMAMRYAAAEKHIWDNLPKWKRIAIAEDRANGILTNRLMVEFVREVIRLAELE